MKTGSWRGSLRVKPFYMGVHLLLHSINLAGRGRGTTGQHHFQHYLHLTMFSHGSIQQNNRIHFFFFWLLALQYRRNHTMQDILGACSLYTIWQQSLESLLLTWMTTHLFSIKIAEEMNQFHCCFSSTIDIFESHNVKT